MSRRREVALWGARPDATLMAYTVADDRDWDARLLEWDILGSLGHARGLAASRLISGRQHREMQRLLREALRSARAGRLRIGQEHEDAHSAVELWLTRKSKGIGGTLHTGRSRNDQVAVDLRLYLKDRLLHLHREGLALADALTGFAARHQRVLWPGYTHQRRAMPSSAGLWAAAYAEGLLDTLESLPALWARIDRSPLGSAAGYGVPLPLKREAAGVRPIEPVLGATLGASMGFMMPVSTAPNAIVYSSGYVPIGKMMRHGVMLDVAAFFIIVTTVMFLGPILF